MNDFNGESNAGRARLALPTLAAVAGPLALAAIAALSGACGMTRASPAPAPPMAARQVPAEVAVILQKYDSRASSRSNSIRSVAFMLS